MKQGLLAALGVLVAGAAIAGATYYKFSVNQPPEQSLYEKLLAENYSLVLLKVEAKQDIALQRITMRSSSPGAGFYLAERAGTNEQCFRADDDQEAPTLLVQEGQLFHRNSQGNEKIGALEAWNVYELLPPNGQALVERVLTTQTELDLASAGCKLAKFDTATPEGASVVRWSFSAQDDNSGFFFKNSRSGEHRLFLGENAGEISCYPAAVVHSKPDGTDPQILASGDACEDWALYEVIAPNSQPAARQKIVHEFSFADGFMRTNFKSGDGWRSESGNWTLNQHGGGMPTNENLEVNAGFQRAVNPFSVLGDAPAGRSGTLVYDGPGSYGDSYYAEARFYFGSPKSTNFKNRARGTVPHDFVVEKLNEPIPEFLIAQGDLDGPQAAFGWWQNDAEQPARWTLCYRNKQTEWQALKTWAKRPPRTTWTRVGLAIENGCKAVAVLDGRRLGECELPAMVRGNFQFHTGTENQQIEFDDVVVRPTILPPGNGGQPIFTQSRYFADKQMMDRNHDPVQFDYWARGANIYVGAIGDEVLGVTNRLTTTNLPFYGEFSYRSTPSLPNGDYQFFILNKPKAETAGDIVGRLLYTKSNDGWMPTVEPPVQNLIIADRDDQLCMKMNQGWKPLDMKVNGGVKLTFNPPEEEAATLQLPPGFTFEAVDETPFGIYELKFQNPTDNESNAIRLTKTPKGWTLGETPPKPVFTLEFGRREGRLQVNYGDRWLEFGEATDAPLYLAMSVPRNDFNPEQHDVRSANTWYNLFEQAPTEWYWRDGLFGMNFRWACQPNWNFMAGNSPEFAALFSKEAYYGDQQVECFMSLQMVLPANMHYYRRADLCVSICTDGRNVDSGYSLIFGAENNSRTILMKRGKEIASTTDTEFRFPIGTNHGEVHWRWWNFRFRKAGGRLVVEMNDEVMFDVADTDPIAGGHVAYWTVGNGFTTSRLNVVAEKRVEEPQTALVDYSRDDGPWQPLFADAVAVRAKNEGWEVTNPMGGGTFAVRTEEKVDLSSKPMLELPMKLDSDAMVNLHIEIDNRQWLLLVTAPIEEMQFLLTPRTYREFLFNKPVIDQNQQVALLLGQTTPIDGKLQVNLGEMLQRKGVNITGEKTISITIGNTSNKDYLMAGFGGNHAGTSYWIGEPQWKPAQ